MSKKQKIILEKNRCGEIHLMMKTFEQKTISFIKNMSKSQVKKDIETVLHTL